MFHQGLLYVRLDNDIVVELLYPTEDWDNSPGLPHISVANYGYGTQPFISSVRTFNGTPNGYRSPNSETFIRYEKATDMQILILMINWNTVNRVSVKGWVNTVAQKCDELVESEKERLLRLSTLSETETMQILTDGWEKVFQQKKYGEAINISKEIITLDNKSYLAHMNFGIAKIMYAIFNCTNSESIRNSHFNMAIDDLNSAFDLVENLPKEIYNRIHGDKLKATCCYYMGVARSHNLIDYPGPWAMKNALGNLEASLKYSDDVEVREYKQKVDNFNKRHQ